MSRGAVRLADQVSEYIEAAKTKAATGMSWAEFGETSLGLLRLVVTGLMRVTTISGPQKKEIAIKATAELFDALATRAVPLLLLPIWLVVRPAARSLVLALAGAVVELLVAVLRRAKA
jgi:hypothetical protein